MAPDLESAYYRSCCGRLHVRDSLVIVLAFELFRMLATFVAYAGVESPSSENYSQRNILFFIFLFAIFVAALYARTNKSAGGLVPLLIVNAFTLGSTFAATVMLVVFTFMSTPDYPFQLKAQTTVLVGLMTLFEFYIFNIIHRAFKYYRQLAVQPILLTTITPAIYRAPPPEYDNLVNHDLEKKESEFI